MSFFVNTDSPGLRAQYGSPAFQIVGGPSGQQTQLAQYRNPMSETQTKVVLGFGLLAMLAAGYHGYRRNDSMASAVGRAAIAAFIPIPVISYAAGQGFAKPG